MASTTTPPLVGHLFGHGGLERSPGDRDHERSSRATAGRWRRQPGRSGATESSSSTLVKRTAYAAPAQLHHEVARPSSTTGISSSHSRLGRRRRTASHQRRPPAAAAAGDCAARRRSGRGRPPSRGRCAARGGRRRRRRCGGHRLALLASGGGVPVAQPGVAGVDEPAAPGLGVDDRAAGRRRAARARGGRPPRRRRRRGAGERPQRRLPARGARKSDTTTTRPRRWAWRRSGVSAAAQIAGVAVLRTGRRSEVSSERRRGASADRAGKAPCRRPLS